MMELLTTFAALSLAAGAVLSLLPDGSLRRTASMVIGLLMLLCWADGIAQLLQLPLAFSPPETVLSPTSADLETSAEAAALLLQERWEGAP